MENPIAEMSAGEIAALVGGGIVYVLFLGFFIWFFWKVIRAQLRLPEELAGIRKALERIADKIERS